MTRLIGVRVVAGVATLVAASVLIFAVMQLLPGDAATANLQQLAAADPSALAQLRHEYGLDRPLAIRYLDWAEGAVQGDFGTVPASGQSVYSLIRDTFEEYCRSSPAHPRALVSTRRSHWYRIGAP